MSERRSVSQRLMRAPAVPVGSKLWLEDSEGDAVYVGVKVVSQENTVVSCVDDAGVVRSFDMGFGEMYVQNEAGESKDGSYEDMTGMQHLHEPGMLANLRTRLLKSGEPYTYMGTVLVAVNPLQPVAQPKVETYVGTAFGSQGPHPYAVAELAFARLGDPSPDAKNQAVVVSGESGAGKTESSKIVVQYLASRGGGGSLLADRVKAASPVLEAFGNAATLRNPNSSRFGRFLKLWFSFTQGDVKNTAFSGKPTLCGGELETYLLEKSRVASQACGESNFHALHQVVSSERKQDALCGGSAPCSIVPKTIDRHPGRRDDKPTYAAVNQALEAVFCGSESDSEDDAWRLLGAVVAIGDVEIESYSEGEATKVDPGSPAMMRVSTCLNFNPTDDVGRRNFAKLITVRVVSTRTETFETPRDEKSARLARDALARNCYALCFEALVAKCNAAISGGGISSTSNKKKKFIGILDVFGFESFEINTFETLLINFANESLQQHFCDSVFEAELRLFEEEGIEAPDVTAPPDSSGTIELVAGRKPPGILKLLDAQAVSGGKSASEADAAFLAKIHSSHARHASLARTHPKDKRVLFAIRHFADEVKYTVVGSGEKSKSWTEANVDAAPDGLAEVILKSSRSSFAKRALADVTQSGRKDPFRKNKMGGTVSAGFSASMTKLRDELRKTDSAFIRCVKPTPKMIPGEVDSKSTCAQLRALGLLAACEVLKVGLPTRVPYESILSKLPESAVAILQGEDKETIVAVALMAFDVPADSYRLGKTRVFFPASALGLMNQLLNFDPQSDPEKAQVIEAKLKLAKEHAGEARACAKQARQLVSKAEDSAQQADDALRAFQLKREQASSAASPQGDEAAPLHRLASASAAKRAADVASRCAADARGFASESSTLCQGHVLQKEPEAAELNRQVSKEADAAEKHAAEARRVFQDMEPKAKTGDAARVQAWETASLLGDRTKAGVLGKCVFQADQASNAAARLQLDKAKSCLADVTSLVDEADRMKTEVRRMLDVAENSEKALVQQAEALQVAELAAGVACDVARTAFDALRQLAVDKQAELQAAKKTLPPPPSEARNRSGSSQQPSGQGLLPNSGLPMAMAGGVTSARASTRFDGAAVAQSIRVGTAQQGSIPEERDPRSDDEDPTVSVVYGRGSTRTPPGWEAHWDDTYGLYYYFNTITGETQWEPPTRPARSSTQLDESAVSAALASSPRGENLSGAAAFESGLPSPVNEAAVMLQKRTSTKRRSSFGSAEPEPPKYKATAYSKEAMADLATERREGYLMKQGKWTSRWKPRWFVLEDSYLEYFEKKAHAAARGGGKKGTAGKSDKVMRLEAKSITSFTDTENCFCVTTGSSSWFLVAPDERDMAEWIAAINAHIISLRAEEKSSTPSEADDVFDPEGVQFARVSSSVEVRTHASKDAPLTGQRLKPGDVVEISRKLDVDGAFFVRLTDFGWAAWLDPDKDHPCFSPVQGLPGVPDSLDRGKPAKFRLFRGALPVPLLKGPTHSGQISNESAIAGETFDSVAQFIHHREPVPGFETDAGATFMKLADGRGWAPLKDPNTGRFLFEKISEAKSHESRSSTRRFSRFLG